MIEKMLEYERDPFFFINGSHFPFADNVMWLFSHTQMWIPFYALILFVIVFKTKSYEWLAIIITIALLIALCDQFSSAVCKPLFARFRPSKHPEFMEEVRTLHGYLGGGKYGFISGHATNSFGIAVFSALLLKRTFYTLVIIIWATLVAVSRVYLGVHFISDIIAGAIVGTVIAFIVYYLYQQYKKLLKEKEFTHYSPKRTDISSYILLAYMIAIIALSQPLMGMYF